jgi:hypothetical protein
MLLPKLFLKPAFKNWMRLKFEGVLCQKRLSIEGKFHWNVDFLSHTKTLALHIRSPPPFSPSNIKVRLPEFRKRNKRKWNWKENTIFNKISKKRCEEEMMSISPFHTPVWIFWSLSIYSVHFSSAVTFFLVCISYSGELANISFRLIAICAIVITTWYKNLARPFVSALRWLSLNQAFFSCCLHYSFVERKSYSLQRLRAHNILQFHTHIYTCTHTQIHIYRKKSVPICIILHRRHVLTARKSNWLKSFAKIP